MALLIAPAVGCLTSQLAYGLDAQSFYHEEVRVHSATVSEHMRTQAVQDALATVLIRLSGMRSILDNEKVRKALGEPSRYLARYSLASTDEQFINAKGDVVPVTLLLLDFDPGAVEGILREAALPIWGLNRPKVVVWWLLDKSGQRSVLSAASVDQDPALQVLRDIAKRRGLELVVPLMDEEDLQHVQTGTVSGVMLDDLSVAAQRYGAEYMVVGRSMQQWQGPWEVTWQWVSPSGVDWRESRSASLELIFEEVAEYVSDTLSGQFAVLIEEGMTTQYWLEVSRVKAMSEYHSLLAYLEALPIMETLRLAHIDQDVLCFEMSLTSGQDQFHRIIRQGRKLVELVDPVVSSPAAPERVEAGTVELGGEPFDELSISAHRPDRRACSRSESLRYQVGLL